MCDNITVEEIKNEVTFSKCTLFIPLKARISFEISLPIEGEGILDVLQATEPKIYKNFMESCHKKIPDNFIYLGREDNIFVYLNCKDTIKKAQNSANNKLQKNIFIERVIVADIEKSILSDNPKLYKPACNYKFKFKNGEEKIFDKFPCMINL